MEDNEHEDTLTLAQLLIKRQKLMDLKKIIINIKENKKTEELVETNQFYRMQKNDFKSTSKIEKKIVNRKVFITKEKVNWLKTKEIFIDKNYTHSIFMKIEIKELNIEKKVKGKILNFSEGDLDLLWPNGKEIAKAKLDDLKSMYHLIPKDCLDFYKSLKANEFGEDVDGLGAEPDFEVEQELDTYNDEEESS